MAIDILLRLLTSGADKTRGDVKGVGDATKGVNQELTKVGDNDGLNQAGAKAEALAGKLEGVRTAGLAIAAVGVVGLAIAESFTKAALEADALGSKTAALLTGADLIGAKKQIQDLGYELAKLGEGDDDEIAKNIAEAVSSGRTMMLRQYGIVIDAVGQKAITAARNISANAGAQEALNQITKQAIPAMKALRDNSSDSALAIAEVEARWDKLQEGIGAGTSQVKGALYSGVYTPILDIIEKSPELQKTAGFVLTIGSAGMAAGGSILALVAQVGMAIPAFQAMGFSGVASFGAIRIAAISAGTAIYTALAPILPLVLAIAAVMIAITAGAVWLQNRAAKKSESETEAMDRLDYDKYYVPTQKKYNRKIKTFEEYRSSAAEDEASGATGDSPQAVNDALKKAQEQANRAMTPPSVPSIAPIVAPIVASAIKPEVEKAVKQAKPSKAAEREALREVAIDPLALLRGGGMAALGTGDGTAKDSAVTTVSGGEAKVGQPSYRQGAGGVWWVKFPDLRLPPGAADNALMAFAR